MTIMRNHMSTIQLVFEAKQLTAHLSLLIGASLTVDKPSSILFPGSLGFFPILYSIVITNTKKE